MSGIQQSCQEDEETKMQRHYTVKGTDGGRDLRWSRSKLDCTQELSPLRRCEPPEMGWIGAILTRAY
jgi:hypothetical protein